MLPGGVSNKRGGHCSGWYASYWNAFLSYGGVSVILCKTECYTSVIFSIFIFILILLLCTPHLYWKMGAYRNGTPV